MMRACIGVTQVEKLWCFEAEPEETKSNPDEGTADTLSSDVKQINEALGSKLISMVAGNMV